MRAFSRPAWLAFLLLSGCTAVIPIQPIRIQGTAMLPALKDGDHALFERNPGNLQRGDIIVFHYPPDPSVSYIKRIIGLPNEVLEIREGKVVINDQIIDEPYIEPKLNVSYLSSPPKRIPADNYFVMGDNRDNSNDSRLWGPLKRELIYGKFIRKY